MRSSMEKKSLEIAPAAKSNSHRVDLSKPAPVRVETCRKAGGSTISYPHT
jgi:hypothetical protein